MSISISRYVQITSGVGGSSVAVARELVGRLFTGNILIPPQSFISFDSAAEVGSYFGNGSEEYQRAVFYFGWISKSVTQADSIQFARWVDVASPPRIFAAQQNNSLYTNWTPITSGSMILTMGEYTYTLASLDFAGVLNNADVATVVQTAINLAGSTVLTGTTNTTTTVTLADTSSLSVGMSVQAADIPFGTTISVIVSSTEITLSQAATGSNVDENITFNSGLWGNATVTYNSGSGGFDLVGGDAPLTGIFPVSVVAGGGGTDITGAGLLGWLPASVNTNGNITPGAIWSIGSPVESVSTTLTNSNALSNNFGSFLFLTNLALDNAQIVEAANWNYALNNVYMYTVGCVASNIGTLQPLLASIGGVGITLSPVLSPIQFPEMCPMMILAATNYDAANAVQNYMFQIFPGLTPSVTDDADANAYDALSVNYYGQTQQAGVQISFYQTGVLQGPPTSPLGMNTYANEIWLKDAAAVAIMNLLLAQTELPANQQGINYLLLTLQSVVNAALLNGTISVNKTLTTQQQLYINEITNDPNAWYQVQSIGYWLNCVIVVVGSDYEAQYTLVYSKDDVINFVEGTHVLI